MSGAVVAPVSPVPEDEELGEDEGVLCELDASVGDRRIKWKRGDAKSIERARARFNELKKKGYAIFRTKKVRVTKFPEKNGTELVASKNPGQLEAETTELPKGQVDKFEPEDRELVAVPNTVGG